jgi:hypothetical protein
MVLNRAQIFFFGSLSFLEMATVWIEFVKLQRTATIDLNSLRTNWCTKVSRIVSHYQDIGDW